MIKELMAIKRLVGKTTVYLWPFVAMSLFLNAIFIYDLVRLYSAMD